MSKEQFVVEVTLDEIPDELVQAETGLDASSTDHATYRGIVLMLSAIVLFACMDALAKYLNRYYPAPGLVWARYFVHMLLMLALFGRRMGFDLVRTDRPRLQILRGLLLAGSTLFYFFALRYLPLAEASAIGFLSPLLVTVLAAPMLGEKIGARRWIAVAVGFIGMLIIVRPGGGLLTPASALPLGMAVCFSTYQIITRKLSHSENPYATLFYSALVGTIALTAVLPFAWKTPTPFHALLIVAMGVLGGVGHFMLIRAFAHAAASVLAPFVYTHLLWAMFFGYAVFGDFPDGWAFIGMLVIVGSGFFVAYGERLHLHRLK